MKTGKSIVDLAIELERQSKAKFDYIADTRVLAMTDAGELAIKNDSYEELTITDHAHTQIAQGSIPLWQKH